MIFKLHAIESNGEYKSRIAKLLEKQTWMGLLPIETSFIRSISRTYISK